jgi:hypothetical protein
MFLHLKSVFRGANLEEITELAGFWRLASADKAHRRHLQVEDLKEKARIGQLDRLYQFEVEALIRGIPPSCKRSREVMEFSQGQILIFTSKTRRIPDSSIFDSTYKKHIAHYGVVIPRRLEIRVGLQKLHCGRFHATSSRAVFPTNSMCVRHRSFFQFENYSGLHHKDLRIPPRLFSGGP